MLPILIELQRLKRLDRTGWTLRGLTNGTESVAAHSFGKEFWGVVETGDFQLEGSAQEILNELFGALLAARRDS